MDTSFQTFFQARWIAFLKANFHSPEQIGVCFGVTAVTAQNWLNGTTLPRGPFVAWALMQFPREAGGIIEQGTQDARAQADGARGCGSGAGRADGRAGLDGSEDERGGQRARQNPEPGRRPMKAGKAA